MKTKREKVFELLKSVPKGKVTTYKQLAHLANTSPRAVGAIMRSNEHPETIPCFKVVAADGSLGGYGGFTKGKMITRKIALLMNEGIEVKGGKISKGYMYSF